VSKKEEKGGKDDGREVQRNWAERPTEIRKMSRPGGKGSARARGGKGLKEVVQSETSRLASDGTRKIVRWGEKSRG